MRIQGYVWAFPGGSTSNIYARLTMFDGFPIEALWLDCEQAGLTAADINLALSACDSFMGNGPKTGIYTGKWFWDQQGWSHLSTWADRPLWTSSYDHIADPDVGFASYGGWQQCQIKQHQGTTSIGSVTEIDLNVARA